MEAKVKAVAGKAKAGSKKVVELSAYLKKEFPTRPQLKKPKER